MKERDPRPQPRARRTLGALALVGTAVLALACSNADSSASGSGGGGPACGLEQAPCGDACVDLTRDPLNCGACGAACAPGKSCVAGSCACPNGSLDCGTGCTPTLADAMNCGSCGVGCQAGQSCSGGTCVCQTGLVSCGDACANLQSDGNHCGACSVSCTGGSVCANGTCAGSCPAGTQPCGSSCVTLSSDALNCGACGLTCGAGQLCVGGACACPAGQALCGGSCVETAVNAMNCGACGATCDAGQTCSGGTCVGGAGGGSGGSGGATGGSAGNPTGGTTGGVTTGGSSGMESGGGGTTGGSPSGGSGALGTGGTNSGGTNTGGAIGGTGGGVTGGAGGAGDRCDVGVWDGSTPRPLSLSGNTFAHDPTMIEADGVFYRFWTGNHIPSATSTNLTNWSSAPTVYPNSYPAWVSTWRNENPGNTFNFPWAPDVSYFGGQYHIYSSFSAFFGDNVSCITHLTTSNIAAGGWVDHQPVVCTTGSENYNAIDADAGLDVDGNPYLAFGSFWNGIMLIGLNADGSRKGSEMTRIAWAREIEAPVLFRRCGYYYLFVTWGLCCPGEGRSIDQLSYRVAVGRSTSILGPYVDRDGNPMVNGGGTLVVQGDDVTWAAAGHSDVLVTGNKIYHLYHAYRQSDGGAQLRIVEMPFDSEGWPVPGGP